MNNYNSKQKAILVSAHNFQRIFAKSSAFAFFGKKRSDLSSGKTKSNDWKLLLS